MRGLLESLPTGVSLSGGLAGDGAEMKETVVCHAGRLHAGGVVTALGFCGPVTVGMGSLGGWDAFGPMRLVTRAHGNVLFELDGEPALALYKRYLGQYAAGLPASGLLFPLRVQLKGEEVSVQTVYLGLGAAYFVNEAGDFAGTGTAGKNGWEWTAKPEIATTVQEVVKIYRNERAARFVTLPAAVR